MRQQKRPPSDSILTKTAARILDKSVAQIRNYAHAGLLHPTITEEGVHIFSRRECEALRASRDASPAA